MGQNTLIISKPSTGSGDDSALYPLKSHRNQKKIDASSGKWDRLNLEVAVPQIKEWKVEFLLLNQNFRSSIPLEIINIKFSKIKYLSLAENQIESMESIVSLEMPSIEYLVLSKNLSITMSSVRKMKFPRLTYLNISYNPTPNLQYLSQMHAPQLHELKFEDSGQKRHCENLQWTLKLHPESLKRVVCLSGKRIRQHKIKRALGKRYPQIEIKMLQTSSYMDLRQYPFYVFDNI